MAECICLVPFSFNSFLLRHCIPQCKQLQLAQCLLECLTVRRCWRDEERVFAFVFIINLLSSTTVLSIFRLNLPVFHHYAAYSKAESYFPSVSRSGKQPRRKRGKFNANEGTKFLDWGTRASVVTIWCLVESRSRLCPCSSWMKWNGTQVTWMLEKTVYCLHLSFPYKTCSQPLGTITVPDVFDSVFMGKLYLNFVLGV